MITLTLTAKLDAYLEAQGLATAYDYSWVDSTPRPSPEWTAHVDALDEAAYWARTNRRTAKTVAEREAYMAEEDALGALWGAIVHGAFAA